MDPQTLYNNALFPANLRALLRAVFLVQLPVSSLTLCSAVACFPASAAKQQLLRRGWGCKLGEITVRWLRPCNRVYSNRVFGKRWQRFTLFRRFQQRHGPTDRLPREPLRGCSHTAVPAELVIPCGDCRVQHLLQHLGLLCSLGLKPTRVSNGTLCSLGFQFPFDRSQRVPCRRQCAPRHAQVHVAQREPL
jgi:hypothetical protein